MATDCGEDYKSCVDLICTKPAKKLRKSRKHRKHHKRADAIACTDEANQEVIDAVAKTCAVCTEATVADDCKTEGFTNCKDDFCNKSAKRMRKHHKRADIACTDESTQQVIDAVAKTCAVCTEATVADDCKTDGFTDCVALFCSSKPAKRMRRRRINRRN